ncbi:hypothetical protein WISP_24693 [Willisornis vidua]|uniref:Uncharacterized protein n=1 Tax=Willisornis vidua TaxID=1566151 RepID=A0ABQ9DTE2_9PASS|nr:hypothetical protein WISP_24693 [Willisornis vidua]
MVGESVVSSRTSIPASMRVEMMEQVELAELLGFYSSASAEMLGRVLEVTDLPEGITRTEADKLFTQLAMAGAKIQWLKETQGRRGDGGGGGGDNSGTPENGRHGDLAALYTIVAVFPSPLAAQNASLRLNNSLSRFKLRVAKKNYDLRVLERASSQ